MLRSEIFLIIIDVFKIERTKDILNPLGTLLIQNCLILNTYQYTFNLKLFNC